MISYKRIYIIIIDILVISSCLTSDIDKCLIKRPFICTDFFENFFKIVILEDDDLKEYLDTNEIDVGKLEVGNENEYRYILSNRCIEEIYRKGEEPIDDIYYRYEGMSEAGSEEIEVTIRGYKESDYIKDRAELIVRFKPLVSGLKEKRIYIKVKAEYIGTEEEANRCDSPIMSLKSQNNGRLDREFEIIIKGEGL